MTYYENLLVNQNGKLIFAKRALLWWGIVHYVTGLIGFVLAAIVTWRWVFVPAIWFLFGLIPANIAYCLVVDYKYVYDQGTLTIYHHRFYGPYKPVVRVPLDEVEWRKTATHTKNCTNCEPTIRFVYQNTLYLLTCDDYMISLLKGDRYVFGQCRDNQDASRC